jgi:hypothetical protein
VTTPDERADELYARALESGVTPVSDPDELARLSIHALLGNVGIAVQVERTAMDVRLHGPRIPGHDVPVRDAAAILGSLQEAVASIGQALTHEPTARGVIQMNILKATELRISSSVGPGSVVFRLIGAADDVLGDETALTGDDALVNLAIRELLSLVEHSETAELETITLAQELRRLGPRAAKHLSDLVKRVVEDEIDVDLTWHGPRGQRQRAALQRRSALAIRDAIDRNRVETVVVELTGTLITISKVMSAELLTEEQGRVKLVVNNEQAATLGPYYDRRVTAIAEQKTTWSTNTGQEKREFRLIDLRLEDQDASDGEPVS